MRFKDFEIRDHDREGHRRLIIRGELDMATGPELEATVAHLFETRLGHLTVDLGGVTFMDSTGMRAVISCHEQCKTHGCTLTLTPGPANVHRVFEISGLSEALPFVGGPSGEGNVTP